MVEIQELPIVIAMDWTEWNSLDMKDGIFINPANDKFWYKNESFHREDGAAIEYSDGTKSWYYEGNYLNVSSQEEFEQWLKYKTFL